MWASDYSSTEFDLGLLRLRYQNVVTHKRVVTAVTTMWSLSVVLAVSFVFVLPGKIAIVIIRLLTFCCNDLVFL